MGELTSYVVLHRWQRPEQNHDGVSSAAAAFTALPGELWHEVFEADATRREDAVEAFLESEAGLALPEGDHEFKSVPRRSWPDEAIPATVTTQRVTTVGRKKEAQSAVAR